MAPETSVVAGVSRLSAEQVRVLGCLLEKQRTTPDTYPLSLNGLRLACNQSTNRDPVVQYDDALLRDALHGLERRGLARLASGAGSRAAKYRHLLDQALPLSGAERAVMTTLMLRGAQTPGELKQRSERMHSFEDLAALQRVLDALIERGLVQRLPRRPGQKEERYAHELGEADDGKVTGRSAAANGAGEQWRDHDEQPPAVATGELELRVTRLEREVAELRARLAGEASSPNAAEHGEGQSWAT
ncbi:MAG TPA: YceH family protein [Solirubrobacteraceae bacterium]|jgi:hypothetical protein|nr:YceH family protein [Solirubrobacteraceae bacterium]